MKPKNKKKAIMLGVASALGVGVTATTVGAVEFNDNNQINKKNSKNLNNNNNSQLFSNNLSENNDGISTLANSTYQNNNFMNIPYNAVDNQTITLTQLNNGSASNYRNNASFEINVSQYNFGYIQALIQQTGYYSLELLVSGAGYNNQPVQSFTYNWGQQYWTSDFFDSQYINNFIAPLHGWTQIALNDPKQQWGPITTPFTFSFQMPDFSELNLNTPSVNLAYTLQLSSAIYGDTILSQFNINLNLPTAQISAPIVEFDPKNKYGIIATSTASNFQNLPYTSSGSDTSHLSTPSEVYGEWQYSSNGGSSWQTISGQDKVSPNYDPNKKTCTYQIPEIRYLDGELIRIKLFTDSSVYGDEYNNRTYIAVSNPSYVTDLAANAGISLINTGSNDVAINQPITANVYFNNSKYSNYRFDKTLTFNYSHQNAADYYPNTNYSFGPNDSTITFTAPDLITSKPSHYNYRYSLGAYLAGMYPVNSSSIKLVVHAPTPYSIATTNVGINDKVPYANVNIPLINYMPFAKNGQQLDQTKDIQYLWKVTPKRGKITYIPAITTFASDTEKGTVGFAKSPELSNYIGAQIELVAKFPMNVGNNTNYITLSNPNTIPQWTDKFSASMTITNTSICEGQYNSASVQINNLPSSGIYKAELVVDNGNGQPVEVQCQSLQNEIEKLKKDLIGSHFNENPQFSFDLPTITVAGKYQYQIRIFPDKNAENTYLCSANMPVAVLQPNVAPSSVNYKYDDDQNIHYYTLPNQITNLPYVNSNQISQNTLTYAWAVYDNDGNLVNQNSLLPAAQKDGYWYTVNPIPNQYANDSLQLVATNMPYEPSGQYFSVSVLEPIDLSFLNFKFNISISSDKFSINQPVTINSNINKLLADSDNSIEVESYNLQKFDSATNKWVAVLGEKIQPDNDGNFNITAGTIVGTNKYRIQAIIDANTNQVAYSNAVSLSTNGPASEIPLPTPYITYQNQLPYANVKLNTLNNLPYQNGKQLTPKDLTYQAIFTPPANNPNGNSNKQVMTANYDPDTGIVSVGPVTQFEKGWTVSFKAYCPNSLGSFDVSKEFVINTEFDKYAMAIVNCPNTLNINEPFTITTNVTNPTPQNINPKDYVLQKLDPNTNKWVDVQDNLSPSISPTTNKPDNENYLFKVQGLKEASASQEYRIKIIVDAEKNEISYSNQFNIQVVAPTAIPTSATITYDKNQQVLASAKLPDIKNLPFGNNEKELTPSDLTYKWVVVDQSNKNVGEVQGTYNSSTNVVESQALTEYLNKGYSTYLVANIPFYGDLTLSNKILINSDLAQFKILDISNIKDSYCYNETVDLTLKIQNPGNLKIQNFVLQQQVSESGTTTWIREPLNKSGGIPTWDLKPASDSTKWVDTNIRVTYLDNNKVTFEVPQIANNYKFRLVANINPEINEIAYSPEFSLNVVAPDIPNLSNISINLNNDRTSIQSVSCKLPEVINKPYAPNTNNVLIDPKFYWVITDSTGKAVKNIPVTPENNSVSWDYDQTYSGDNIQLFLSYGDSIQPLIASNPLLLNDPAASLTVNLSTNKNQYAEGETPVISISSQSNISKSYWNTYYGGATYQLMFGSNADDSKEIASGAFNVGQLNLDTKQFELPYVSGNYVFTFVVTLANNEKITKTFNIEILKPVANTSDLPNANETYDKNGPATIIVSNIPGINNIPYANGKQEPIKYQWLITNSDGTTITQVANVSNGNATLNIDSSWENKKVQLEAVFDNTNDKVILSNTFTIINPASNISITNMTASSGCEGELANLEATINGLTSNLSITSFKILDVSTGAEVYTSTPNDIKNNVISASVRLPFANSVSYRLSLTLSNSEEVNVEQLWNPTILPITVGDLSNSVPQINFTSSNEITSITLKNPATITNAPYDEDNHQMSPTLYWEIGNDMSNLVPVSKNDDGSYILPYNPSYLGKTVQMVAKFKGVNQIFVVSKTISVINPISNVQLEINQIEKTCSFGQKVNLTATINYPKDFNSEIAGKATYTIYDSSNNPVVGYTNVSLSGNQINASINLPWNQTSTSYSIKVTFQNKETLGPKTWTINMAAPSSNANSDVAINWLADQTIANISCNPSEITYVPYNGDSPIKPVYKWLVTNGTSQSYVDAKLNSDSTYGLDNPNNYINDQIQLVAEFINPNNTNKPIYVKVSKNITITNPASSVNVSLTQGISGSEGQQVHLKATVNSTIDNVLSNAKYSIIGPNGETIFTNKNLSSNGIIDEVTNLPSKSGNYEYELVITLSNGEVIKGNKWQANDLAPISTPNSNNQPKVTYTNNQISSVVLDTPSSIENQPYNPSNNQLINPQYSWKITSSTGSVSYVPINSSNGPFTLNDAKNYDGSTVVVVASFANDHSNDVTVSQPLTISNPLNGVTVTTTPYTTIESYGHKITLNARINVPELINPHNITGTYTIYDKETNKPLVNYINVPLTSQDIYVEVTLPVNKPQATYAIQVTFSNIPNSTDSEVLATQTWTVNMHSPNPTNLADPQIIWNSNRTINTVLYEYDQNNIKYQPYDGDTKLTPKFIWVVTGKNHPGSYEVTPNGNNSFMLNNPNDYMDDTIQLFVQYSGVEGQFAISNKITLNNPAANVNVTLNTIDNKCEGEKINLSATVANIPSNLTATYKISHNGKVLDSKEISSTNNQINYPYTFDYNSGTKVFTLSITLSNGEELPEQQWSINVLAPTSQPTNQPVISFSGEQIKEISINKNKIAPVENKPYSNGTVMPDQYQWAIVEEGQTQAIYVPVTADSNGNFVLPYNDNYKNASIQLVDSFKPNLANPIPVSQAINVNNPLWNIKFNIDSIPDTVYGKNITLHEEITGNNLDTLLKGATYTIKYSNSTIIVPDTNLQGTTISQVIKLPLSGANATYYVSISLTNGEVITRSVTVTLLSPHSDANNPINVEWNPDHSIKQIFATPNSITNAPYNGNNEIPVKYYWAITNGNNPVKYVPTTLENGNCSLTDVSNLIGSTIQLVAVYDGYNTTNNAIPVSVSKTLTDPALNVNINVSQNVVSGNEGQNVTLSANVSGLTNDLYISGYKVYSKSNPSSPCLTSNDAIKQNGWSINATIQLPLNKVSESYSMVVTLSNNEEIKLDNQWTATINQPTVQLTNANNVNVAYSKQNQISSIIATAATVQNEPCNGQVTNVLPKHYYWEINGDSSNLINATSNGDNTYAVEEADISKCLNQNIQLVVQYEGVNTLVPVSNTIKVVNPADGIGISVSSVTSNNQGRNTDLTIAFTGSNNVDASSLNLHPTYSITDSHGHTVASNVSVPSKSFTVTVQLPLNETSTTYTIIVDLGNNESFTKTCTISSPSPVASSLVAPTVEWNKDCSLKSVTVTPNKVNNEPYNGASAITEGYYWIVKTSLGSKKVSATINGSSVSLPIDQSYIGATVQLFAQYDGYTSTEIPLSNEITLTNPMVAVQVTATNSHITSCEGQQQTLSANVSGLDTSLSIQKIVISNELGVVNTVNNPSISNSNISANINLPPNLQGISNKQLNYSVTITLSNGEEKTFNNLWNIEITPPEAHPTNANLPQISYANNEISQVSVAAANIINPQYNGLTVNTPTYYWVIDGIDQKVPATTLSNNEFALTENNLATESLSFDKILNKTARLVAMYPNNDTAIVVSEPILVVNPVKNVSLNLSNIDPTNVGKTINLTGTFANAQTNLPKGLTATYDVYLGDKKLNSSAIPLTTNAISYSTNLPLDKSITSATYHVVVTLSNGETITSNNLSVSILQPTSNADAKINVQWNENRTIKSVSVSPSEVTNEPYNGADKIPVKYVWRITSSDNQITNVGASIDNGVVSLSNPNSYKGSKSIQLFAYYDGYNTDKDTTIAVSQPMSLDDPVSKISVTISNASISGCEGQNVHLTGNIENIPSDIEIANYKIVNKSGIDVKVVNNPTLTNGSFDITAQLPINTDINQDEYQLVLTLNNNEQLTVPSKWQVTINYPSASLSSNNDAVVKFDSSNNTISSVLVNTPASVTHAPYNGDSELTGNYVWVLEGTNKTFEATQTDNGYSLTTDDLTKSNTTWNDIKQKSVHLAIKYSGIDKLVQVSNSIEVVNPLDGVQFTAEITPNNTNEGRQVTLSASFTGNNLSTNIKNTTYSISGPNVNVQNKSLTSNSINETFNLPLGVTSANYTVTVNLGNGEVVTKEITVQMNKPTSSADANVNVQWNEDRSIKSVSVKPSEISYPPYNGASQISPVYYWEINNDGKKEFSLAIDNHDGTYSLDKPIKGSSVQLVAVFKGYNDENTGIPVSKSQSLADPASQIHFEAINSNVVGIEGQNVDLLANVSGVSSVTITSAEISDNFGNKQTLTNIQNGKNSISIRLPLNQTTDSYSVVLTLSNNEKITIGNLWTATINQPIAQLTDANNVNVVYSKQNQISSITATAATVQNEPCNGQVTNVLIKHYYWEINGDSSNLINATSNGDNTYAVEEADISKCLNQNIQLVVQYEGVNTLVPVSNTIKVVNPVDGIGISVSSVVSNNQGRNTDLTIAFTGSNNVDASSLNLHPTYSITDSHGHTVASNVSVPSKSFTVTVQLPLNETSTTYTIVVGLGNNESFTKICTISSPSPVASSLVSPTVEWNKDCSLKSVTVTPNKVNNEPYNGASAITEGYYWIVKTSSGSKKVLATINGNSVSLPIDQSYIGATVQLFAQYDGYNATEIPLSNEITLTNPMAAVQVIATNSHFTSCEGQQQTLSANVSGLDTSLSIQKIVISNELGVVNTVNNPSISNSNISANINLPPNLQGISNKQLNYSVTITLSNGEEKTFNNLWNIEITPPEANPTNANLPQISYANNEISQVSVTAANIINPQYNGLTVNTPTYYWVIDGIDQKVPATTLSNNEFALTENNLATESLSFDKILNKTAHLVAMYPNDDTAIVVSEPILVVNPVKNVSLTLSNIDPTNVGKTINLTGTFANAQTNLPKDLTATYDVYLGDKKLNSSAIPLTTNAISYSTNLPLDKSITSATYHVVVTLSNGETITSNNLSVSILQPTSNADAKINVQWNEDRTIKSVSVSPSEVTNEPYNGANKIPVKYVWRITSANNQITNVDASIDNGVVSLSNQNSYKGSKSIQLFAYYDGYNTDKDTTIAVSQPMGLDDPASKISVTISNASISGCEGQNVHLTGNIENIPSDIEIASYKIVNKSGTDVKVVNNPTLTNGSFDITAQLPINTDINQDEYQLVLTLNNNEQLTIPSKWQVTINYPSASLSSNNDAVVKFDSSNNTISSVLVNTPASVTHAPYNGDSELTGNYVWVLEGTNKTFEATQTDNGYSLTTNDLNKANTNWNNIKQKSVYLAIKYNGIDKLVQVSNSISVVNPLDGVQFIAQITPNNTNEGRQVTLSASFTGNNLSANIKNTTYSVSGPNVNIQNKSLTSNSINETFNLPLGVTSANYTVTINLGNGEVVTKEITVQMNKPTVAHKSDVSIQWTPNREVSSISCDQNSIQIDNVPYNGANAISPTYEWHITDSDGTNPEVVVVNSSNIIGGKIQLDHPENYLGKNVQLFVKFTSGDYSWEEPVSENKNIFDPASNIAINNQNILINNQIVSKACENQNITLEGNISGLSADLTVSKYEILSSNNTVVFTSNQGISTNGLFKCSFNAPKNVDSESYTINLYLSNSEKLSINQKWTITIAHPYANPTSANEPNISYKNNKIDTVEVLPADIYNVPFDKDGTTPLKPIYKWFINGQMSSATAELDPATGKYILRDASQYNGDSVKLVATWGNDIKDVNDVSTEVTITNPVENAKLNISLDPSSPTNQGRQITINASFNNAFNLNKLLTEGLTAKYKLTGTNISDSSPIEGNVTSNTFAIPLTLPLNVTSESYELIVILSNGETVSTTFKISTPNPSSNANAPINLTWNANRTLNSISVIPNEVSYVPYDGEHVMSSSYQWKITTKDGQVEYKEATKGSNGAYLLDNPNNFIGSKIQLVEIFKDNHQYEKEILVSAEKEIINPTDNIKVQLVDQNSIEDCEGKEIKLSAKVTGLYNSLTATYSIYDANNNVLSNANNVLISNNEISVVTKLPYNISKTSYRLVITLSNNEVLDPYEWNATILEPETNPNETNNGVHVSYNNNNQISSISAKPSKVTNIPYSLDGVTEATCEYAWAIDGNTNINDLVPAEFNNVTQEYLLPNPNDYVNKNIQLMVIFKDTNVNKAYPVSIEKQVINPIDNVKIVLDPVPGDIKGDSTIPLVAHISGIPNDSDATYTVTDQNGQVVGNYKDVPINSSNVDVTIKVKAPNNKNENKYRITVNLKNGESKANTWIVKVSELNNHNSYLWVPITFGVLGAIATTVGLTWFGIIMSKKKKRF